MMEERAKRKLSAILSADVKGYSRLMEEDELVTIRTLEDYRSLMSEVIIKYRGRIVDSPGDNVLAEFASVVDAVESAVEIQKELKAKSTKIVVKELRFGPNTDDHDYNFKLKHAQKFLEDGAKVKAFVFFKGRSIIYSEKGEILLLRFAQDLEDLGKVEQLPKLEGKRMTMILSPKTAKKK